MDSTQDLKKRTLTIEKSLKAPIALVWEAWKQPEHISQWWGPMGMETTVLEHNFNVGGTWKYSMHMPGKGNFITEGVYSEIVEFERIVTTADFKPMTEGVVLQALFEADGNNTKFTFNVIHKTEEYCKQQEEMGFYNGWGSVFNRLDEYLIASQH